MENNQDQNQTVSPMQPVNPQMPQDPALQAQPTSPAPQKKSRNSLVILIILLVLLLVGGAGAWFVLKGDDEKSSSADTSQKDSGKSDSTQETSSQLIKTQFVSAYQPRNTVTVEHPENWKVEQYIKESYDDYGTIRNYTLIGSPSGHYLHILNVDGIGGYCDPDTKTYTLTKKLATKTKDIFFTEYEIDGRSTGLRLEHIYREEGQDTLRDKHISLAEGQSNTNTCNIGLFPYYGGYVKLRGSASRDASNDVDLTFADIKDDEAFVKMLQSFEAVDIEKGE